MLNMYFFKEDQVPRTQFEARKVAGSATYKQSRAGRFVYSVMKTKRGCLRVCFEHFSLTNKSSSTKLQTAPLIRLRKEIHVL